MRIKTLFTLIVLVSVLQSCIKVGPDYEQPKVNLEKNFNNREFVKSENAENINWNWWEKFNDKDLNKYLKIALNENHQLKVAVERINEARSRLKITTGDRFPSLDLDSSAIKQKTSEGSLFGSFNETLYSASLVSSWELDIFGRVRRNVEAMKANLSYINEAKKGVETSLLSSVAINYINIRVLQKQILLANENVKSQDEILKLSKNLFKNGLINQKELNIAENQLLNEKANLTVLNNNFEQALNSFEFLLGQKPGTLHKDFENFKDIKLPDDSGINMLPADLLRIRPDVKMAEMNLRKEVAGIGIAKAEYYPSLSLTGTIGYQAFSSSGLINSNNKFYNFGPSLKWNIFAGNKIRSQVKAQESLAKQALINYEESVLNALKEVENSLKSYVENRKKYQLNEKSYFLAKNNYENNLNLYNQGLIDYKTLLNSRNSLNNTISNLYLSTGDVAYDFISVYTNLGGGWINLENEKLENLKKENKKEIKNIVKGDENE